MMETGPQDEPTRARLSLLRGRMAFRAGMSVNPWNCCSTRRPATSGSTRA
jgi:hypothetical protein